jgi:uncharacterized protein YjiS (DUF1127 family)
MMRHFTTTEWHARKARLAAYRKQRSELEGLSAADLADIGIKRFQLGHVARQRCLR